MKLNNRGWGLSFLIVIGTIFLLILILVSLRIRSMTHQIKDEGFIESLPDPEAEGECKGYVMIKDEDSVEPFVKCSKYETLNYDLWVD